MGHTCWMKRWLLYILEKKKYDVFNLFSLSRVMRILLWRINLHTVFKELIVVHGNRLKHNVLMRLGYCFGKKWLAGFISNFKYVIRNWFFHTETKKKKKKIFIQNRRRYIGEIIRKLTTEIPAKRKKRIL